MILWDVSNGSTLGPPLKAGPGSLTDLAWSPDGGLVAASAEDNAVYVWDVYSRQLLQKLGLFTDNVNSVAFSRYGDFLAAGSRDMSVRIWSTSIWRQPRLLKEHKDAVLSVRFGPDGQTLVTASRDKTVRVFQHTYDWLSTPFLGQHVNAVTKASFSPDGKLIVTASEDNSAIVWDAERSSPVARLLGSSGFVYDASFSPDGKLIVTASGDGAVRLWELHPNIAPNSTATDLISATCSRLTRNMTQEEWRQYMGSDPYRATCPNINGAN